MTHPPLQRWARLEGLTLIVLLLVAVPAKYILHQRAAVRIVGPIHGIAFLVYAKLLIEGASGGQWSSMRALKALACAFLPFGFLLKASRCWESE